MTPGGGASAAVVSAWLARYEQAWRTPGTALLASLFTDDATYRMSPFEEEHRGLAAIGELWERERDSPNEDFELATELVAASGDQAVVRVEVRYGPPKDQQYRDLWIVRFESDGRCRAFEEWPFWPASTHAPASRLREAPAGFEPLATSPFVAHLGPVFVNRHPPRPRFAAEVQSHHANTMGDAHGGFVMALVDIAAGQGARAILGEDGRLRTVSTTVDFLGPAAIGEWIEIEVAVDHAGRRTVFVACRVFVGDRPVGRASVVLSRSAAGGTDRAESRG